MNLDVVCTCGHARRHHGHGGVCIAAVGEGSVCPCLAFTATTPFAEHADDPAPRLTTDADGTFTIDRVEVTGHKSSNPAPPAEYVADGRNLCAACAQRAATVSPEQVDGDGSTLCEGPHGTAFHIGFGRESKPGPETVRTTPLPVDVVALPPLVGPDRSPGRRPTLPEQATHLDEHLAAANHDPTRCRACGRKLRRGGPTEKRNEDTWLGHAKDCTRHGQPPDAP